MTKRQLLKCLFGFHIPKIVTDQNNSKMYSEGMWKAFRYVECCYCNKYLGEVPTEGVNRDAKVSKKV